MFKQLKRTHQEASNSSVETEQAAKRVNATSETSVTKKSERKMNFFKSWKDADRFECVKEKDYKGEDTITLKDGQYNANVTTAPMSVKFSDVGPKGNLGTRFVPEGAFQQAKYVMTIEQGADSKVVGAMPTIDADQEGYFNALKNIGTRMLTKAWDEKLPMFASHIKKAKADAKKEAKKNADLNVDDRAKELFLERATVPVKDYVDEDGDATPVNKMARRYQYTDKNTGEIVMNRPAFWKANREGGYDDITDETKWLSKGTVVITQVTFRCYTMSSHYGVATDMGKNIIVVWAKPSTSKKDGGNPTVPYIE